MIYDYKFYYSDSITKRYYEFLTRIYQVGIPDRYQEYQSQISRIDWSSPTQIALLLWSFKSRDLDSNQGFLFQRHTSLRPLFPLYPWNLFVPTKLVDFRDFCPLRLLFPPYLHLNCTRVFIKIRKGNSNLLLRISWLGG